MAACSGTGRLALRHPYVNLQPQGCRSGRGARGHGGALDEAQGVSDRRAIAWALQLLELLPRELAQPPARSAMHSHVDHGVRARGRLTQTTPWRAGRATPGRSPRCRFGDTVARGARALGPWKAECSGPECRSDQRDWCMAFPVMPSHLSSRPVIPTARRRTGTPRRSNARPPHRAPVSSGRGRSARDDRRGVDARVRGEYPGRLVSLGVGALEAG